MFHKVTIMDMILEGCIKCSYVVNVNSWVNMFLNSSDLQASVGDFPRVQDLEFHEHQHTTGLGFTIEAVGGGISKQICR
jgi:hypothetical protein